jgi:hypothetical protein
MFLDISVEAVCTSCPVQVYKAGSWKTRVKERLARNALGVG